MRHASLGRPLCTKPGKIIIASWHCWALITQWIHDENVMGSIVSLQLALKF